MSIKTRFVLIIPVIILLIILIIQSFNRGLASLFYMNIERYVSAPVSHKNLQLASDLLDQANEFSANNAKNYQLKGVVNSWKAYQFSEDPIKNKNYHHQAYLYYQKSLLLNPDNPYTWLNLAKLKVLQQDNNYSLFLQNSLKYGHSLQDIILGYLDLKLNTWQQLTPDKKRELSVLAQDIITAKDFNLDKNKYRFRLNQILLTHQLKYQVCSQMQRSSSVRYFCRLKTHNVPEQLNIISN